MRVPTRKGTIQYKHEMVKASRRYRYPAITAWDHEIRFAPNRSSALPLHGYAAERPAAPTVNRKL